MPTRTGDSAVGFMLGAALCAGLFASTAEASITGIAFANLSSPDVLNVQTGRVREFQTFNAGHGGAFLTGNTFSFTNHFQWQLAHIVQPGGGTVALTFGGRAAYTLGFTVQDPTNIGYTLTVDTLLRGAVTASFAAGNSVQSSGSLITGRIDTGTGLMPSSDLLLGGALVTANGADPFMNQVVNNNNSLNAGPFIGTNTFLLEFDTSPSNNASAILQNNTTGWGAVRYGLNPTNATLLAAGAGTPGVDGEAAADHGHFTTVNVEFNSTPIPEPGTFILLGLGLLGLAAQRRRARASRRP